MQWRKNKESQSSLDSKEIKPVNCKGNPPWIFIGRTSTEAEDPILWPPDVKSQLIGKDPDAGKDWGQEEKGMTEDEMVEWHHWLSGHEFEQALEDSEGQGSLECCSPWGCKESDTTEWLNNNVIAFYKCFIYPWNKVHQFPKLMVEGCYICCSNIFLTKIFDLLVYLLSRKVL